MQIEREGGNQLLVCRKSGGEPKWECCEYIDLHIKSFTPSA